LGVVPVSTPEPVAGECELGALGPEPGLRRPLAPSSPPLLEEDVMKKRIARQKTAKTT